MIQLAYRYRLMPTEEQRHALAHIVGATRFIYNLALEQRRDFWRHAKAAGVIFNFVTQGREIKTLRAENDWLNGVPATALHQALRDLDRAFQGFFRGRTGFPTFRCKGRHDSFRIQGGDLRTRRINRRWSEVRLPNLGWVRYRDTRPLPSTPVNATFSLGPDGWFVAFPCEREGVASGATDAVGIDRGVANTLALSTGELLSAPDCSRIEQRRRRIQRALRRKVRGSNRHYRQRRRMAAIAARIARVRADWRMKSALDIARRNSLAVVEDLKVIHLSKRGNFKRGLNRSIREQGWSAFASALFTKLEERGGRLVKVNPAYTSQECSACGTIDKASRESQARFACRHCGFAGHADTNAALNILRRGTALMRVEGGGYAPVEARTVGRAAQAA